MIVKMKFLSITGPKADIDRVVDQYLSKYEIHLENALSELKTVQELRPFLEINPYRDPLGKAEEFLELLGSKSLKEPKEISIEKALDMIKTLEQSLSKQREAKAALEQEKEKLSLSMSKLKPFKELDYDIESILHFGFVKFRFGRIPNEYYEKFEKFVYNDLDTFFFKCECDDTYIWGVYFVPEVNADKIDAVYSSMHFERFFLPDEYDGTPADALSGLERRIQDLNRELDEINQKMTAELEGSYEELYAAANRLRKLSDNFDIRKLAACTRENHEVFYILCGWMTEKDAKAFQKEIDQDEKIFCIIEDDHNNVFSKPPTKLKNIKLFRPFEMYVKMYGLPDYQEFDPTIFIALTYSFIFGAMFGDVGQGICLMAGGFLLYKLKHMDLAGIIAGCGIFSTIFGFLFGSVFGFENIIEPIWLRPKEAMSVIPFVGNLNTVFIVAIAFGMLLIMLTMAINIMRGFKAKDMEAALFDTNGIAGLVFYAAVVLVLVLFMTGNPLPGGIVLALLFGLPLIAIALKEPLTALVEKKAEVLPKEKGMFIVQTVFEMFEVLLSYFSNTLSFVRIGAFAVSHAAMMEVVLMLAGAENGGSPNWLVVIFGNLFVMGMEGLIVGIQVLRLEYYEFFSRFYKGTGREFKPYAKQSRS